MAPFFKVRDDYCRVKPLVARVTNIFKSGFVVSPENIYFTTIQLRVSPNSVLLERDCNFKLNQKVLFSENNLEIESVKYEPAEKIKLYKCPALIDYKLLQLNNEKIKKCLKLFARRSSITELFFEPFGRNNTEFKENIEAISKRAANLSQIKDFCGYGKGLTPSFDDFISGMLFTDRYYKRNIMLITADYLRALHSKTTQTACQQIFYCSNGVLNVAFEKFLHDICFKEVNSCEILKLIDYGQTSGSDILCGISSYLDYYILSKNLVRE